MTHAYRSHTCGQLRIDHKGQGVRLSGWVHRVRDHGGLLFIDLRDHYGLTQIVIDPSSPAFKVAEKARSEWVIRVDGKVQPSLHNIRKVTSVTTYGGSWFRAALMGDPPKKLVSRMLRATVKPGASVSYIAHYSMNLSTQESREKFMAKVAARMETF